ncbi:glycoside hydrolase family 15 protein [Streptacidiphilus pinicola]|uniref:Glycoside hydrolase family 15 protein n=1 Tax=Streptacidiphilus pinicola TaxID=2219663 RepID=A0A2X0IFT8_9ACTN|nr:glycoside hydrolase family 15 protein [Streptacidiphilus pinicola]
MAADRRRAGRTGGHVPLRDYAVIGDGRTAALVAADGSVDWLTIPYLDSPSVFAAVLDPRDGGCFQLEPTLSYTVERRYLPGTNLLETTYRTAHGAVRLTDALTLPDSPPLAPGGELVRRLEGLAGSVPMHWSVRPRFDYGRHPARFSLRAGVPVAAHGRNALAVSSWGAGPPIVSDDAVSADVTLSSGESALIAVPFAHQEPLVLPARSDCEQRLVRTRDRWRSWAGARTYEGRWREAVQRSALVLKLLVFAPSGAIAAAATTSLPEWPGGERNWDYRYSWVRDSAFTLQVFLHLDCLAEAHAYFWWLMQASQLTHPRLRVLYRLDGGPHARERVLPLSGYLDSRPVRVGNAAVDQVQLDTYGELLQTAWLYAKDAATLDRDLARRLAEIADFVCAAWRRPDSGIWEVRSAPAHFTQSKMMCWLALDRALDLAEHGIIPARHAARWRQERAAARTFIETRCFSARLGSYTRAAGSEDLDAAVLLGVLYDYGGPDNPRLRGTVDAISAGLRHGPYVARYSGEDGLAGPEGAFLACSFWLAEAVARTGRVEEATELMNELVDLANDVGLYSEETDPATGAFLGNLPQALSHLALIRAALAISTATPEASP